MAEERVDSREASWQQLMPWTVLFRCFQVSLDLNKLLLAAAGIAAMSFGWWVLAWAFTVGEAKSPPLWPSKYEKDAKGWAEFRKDRLHWNLMNKAIGLDENQRSEKSQRYEVQDIAETLDEYRLFEKVKKSESAADARQEFLAEVKKLEDANAITADEGRRYRAKASQYALLGKPKPAGLLSVSPWSEDRGPNPYLLATGQTGIPWDPGHFWDWFTRDQALVIFEPLVKLGRPIFYFLSPDNNFASRCYFLLVSLWTLVVWSVFGGAITRIAVVQLARGEKIGIFEAFRFVIKRFVSYAVAPLFVLAFCFFLAVVMAVFYLVGMIPIFGDLFAGLLFPVPLVLGLLMAVALVGLVGWPLMAATISAEGTDSWEAVSRSYSYVYQRPWQCLWYSLVAVAYGGICVFFIGLMASFSVSLAKWGMNQAPFVKTADREPHFLFVYAPTSFGWRDLLLEGAEVSYPKDRPDDQRSLEGVAVVRPRADRLQSAGFGVGNRWSRIDDDAYQKYHSESLRWWNKAGAGLTAFWLGLVFLMMLGFGYSFFWCASTIIYLLLRKSVDAAEMDEVYLEEDDEPSFQMPAPAPAPAPASARSLPMVESPKPAPPPAPAPMPAPAPTPVATAAPAPEPVKPPEAVKPPEPPSEPKKADDTPIV